MLNLLWIFASSCCCSLVLTPLARAAAARCGLLDRPDGRRKTQSAPVPRTGGLAVLASALLVLTASALLPPFAELRELRDRLRRDTGLSLPDLSMGMSNDFEVAIEEGATFVRIGSTIFAGLEAG